MCALNGENIMNTKRINIFTYLLLLIAVACGSACSLTKIKAQSPNQKSITVNANNTGDSSETTYKPPKRISKDIIKTEEKPTKTKTK